MRIDRLTLTGFRNIGEMELSPCPGVNVIYGDNAQGKTNLMEAIYLFTGAKSFRGAKDREMVGLGEVKTLLQLEFFGEGRAQTAQISLAPKKAVLLNEILLDSSTKLAGQFTAVVFSPSHLSLIQDGPQERRRFLDTTICQLKPKYIRVLNDYSRVLAQRNSLLKDVAFSSYLLDTLDIWDQHLVRLSATITRTRYTYLEKLKQLAGEVYKGISREKEEFSLRYLSKACPDLADLSAPGLEEAIAEAVRKARREDLKAGSTTVGAHRDDLEISINGMNVRTYGSQGQQRSAVLALKLSECGMIRQLTGEEPVVLLDDVMSELDESRREYLLNHMGDRQIFITCCDPNYFRHLEDGKSFHIQGGAIYKVEEYGRPQKEENPCISI
ncbi:DNA replication/repair protein RecF [Merdimmobilis hominis]|uniref:DNA replication/repair protein RecF n=1 Tax=Merdimmobilis hominis TaxID=2897707 RepID=UPI002803833B|nr:DNA replication/repair protein RecF [uncultured Merdimmobilis sp.]